VIKSGELSRRRRRYGYRVDPLPALGCHEPFGSQLVAIHPKFTLVKQMLYMRVYDGIRCPIRTNGPPMHDLPTKQSRRTYPPALPVVSQIHYWVSTRAFLAMHLRLSRPQRRRQKTAQQL
jgi:hypothetical protein